MKTTVKRTTQAPPWLLTLLLCGCTHIVSYVPDTLPFRPGPYILDARANSLHLTVVVDDKRFQMVKGSKDWWSAAVELRDGARVSFEVGRCRTAPQVIKIVPAFVR